MTDYRSPDWLFSTWLATAGDQALVFQIDLATRYIDSLTQNETNQLAAMKTEHAKRKYNRSAELRKRLEAMTDERLQAFVFANQLIVGEPLSLESELLEAKTNVEHGKEEQARRRASFHLYDRYCRFWIFAIGRQQKNVPRYHWVNAYNLYKRGKAYISSETVAIVDRFVKFINRLDQQELDYLIEHLPDRILDPIVDIACAANDCVYMVGDKAIGD